MKRLGIRVAENRTDPWDALDPDSPYLGFCYARSGYIRLAGDASELGICRRGPKTLWRTVFSLKK